MFAQNSDISSGMLYSGEKYDYLKSAGFNYFISPCAENDPFTLIADEYVRQGRLIVSKETMTSRDNLFTGIMETEGILEESRSNYD